MNPGFPGQPFGSQFVPPSGGNNLNPFDMQQLLGLPAAPQPGAFNPIGIPPSGEDWIKIRTGFERDGSPAPGSRTREFVDDGMGSKKERVSVNYYACGGCGRILTSIEHIHGWCGHCGTFHGNECHRQTVNNEPGCPRCTVAAATPEGQKGYARIPEAVRTPEYRVIDAPVRALPAPTPASSQNDSGDVTLLLIVGAFFFGGVLAALLYAAVSK